MPKYGPLEADKLPLLFTALAADVGMGPAEFSSSEAFAVFSNRYPILLSVMHETDLRMSLLSLSVADAAALDAAASAAKRAEQAAAECRMWRARCKEAQRCMRNWKPRYLNNEEWCAARDAGKDE